MSYDLRLNLRNPDGSDAGFLDGVTAFSVQPDLNGVGGATLSIPRNAPSYPDLRRILSAAGRVVLWLYDGDERLRRDFAAVILKFAKGTDRSSAGAGEIITFTGTCAEGMLDDAPSGDIAADEPMYLPDGYGPAGKWIYRALIRVQQKLGALTDIDPSFTEVTDSRGNPWARAVSITHGEDDSVLTMCSTLANQRDIDFRIRAKDDDSGYWLDALNFGTMGLDQSAALVLEGNAQSVSRETGNVERYNVLIARHTDLTARVVVEDTAAIAAAGGHRIVKTLTCPFNIADEAALRDWAVATLTQNRKAEFSVTHTSMRHEQGNQPRLGRDFGLGDYLSSWSDESLGFERLRVESGRLALIRNASAETTVTLGYSHRDIRVRLYHGGDYSDGTGSQGLGYSAPNYLAPPYSQAVTGVGPGLGGPGTGGGGGSGPPTISRGMTANAPEGFDGSYAFDGKIVQIGQRADQMSMVPEGYTKATVAVTCSALLFSVGANTESLMYMDVGILYAGPDQDLPAQSIQPSEALELTVLNRGEAATISRATVLAVEPGGTVAVGIGFLRSDGPGNVRRIRLSATVTYMP